MDRDQQHQQQLNDENGDDDGYDAAGADVMKSEMDAGDRSVMTTTASSPSKRRKTTDNSDHNDSAVGTAEPQPVPVDVPTSSASSAAPHHAEAGEANEEHQQPVTTDSSDSKKKTKKKTRVTADEYSSLTRMVILILKHKEEFADADYQGVTWRSVIEECLQQFQEELTSQEIFDSKQRLVHQVIRRMIKSDGTIIETGGPYPEGTPSENKLIRLHPSVVV